jgi:hypothetical protein
VIAPCSAGSHAGEINSGVCANCTERDFPGSREGVPDLREYPSQEGAEQHVGEVDDEDEVDSCRSGSMDQCARHFAVMTTSHLIHRRYAA